MENTAAISNVPEFANIPEIPRDLGNHLWAGVGQGIDVMMNNIIEGAGNFLGAAVNFAAAKTLDTAAGIGGAAMSVGSAPFKEGFIPSLSPRGQSIEAPRVPSKSIERSVEPASFGSLGELSAPSTPSLGVAAGFGRSF